MRRATLLLFAASLLCAQDPPPSGSIHGVIKDDATGLPVPGVLVRAVHRSASLTVSIGEKGNVQTDDQGRYNLTGLLPGSFRLSASRAGHTTAARTILLIAGQDLGVDFLLAAPPTISGRVLDENKKPVRGAYVWLIHSEYRSGALRRSRIGPKNTGDDGSFLFDDIEAGPAYYLLAEHPTAGGEKRIAAPTYFGEATSLDAAAPVTLRPGEHREQADITMRIAATYCVDGEIRAAGKPASAPVIIQEAALAGTGPTMVPTYEASEDGSFQACGLTPAEYLASTSTDNLTTRELFTIAGADVHRVHLNLASASLRWELAWDSAPPAETEEEGPIVQSDVEALQLPRKLFGLPVGPEIAAILSRTNSDAQVRLTKSAPYSYQSANPLSAGDYTIEANVSPGSYIKEITYGEVVVTDGLLHLAPGSSGTLRIVASQGGSTIAAIVTDSDDHPVPDATVVIVPESVATAQQFSALAHQGVTDTSGSFTSMTLAPGKYRVLALTRPYRQTPEEIDKILLALSDAQTVELAPKSSVNVSLQPVRIEF